MAIPNSQSEEISYTHTQYAALEHAELRLLSSGQNAGNKKRGVRFESWHPLYVGIYFK